MFLLQFSLSLSLSLSQAGGGGVTLASLSPVKVENTTSVEALAFEYALVQSALKSGHKDPATVQRGRQVGCGLWAVGCGLWAVGV